MFKARRASSFRPTTYPDQNDEAGECRIKWQLVPGERFSERHAANQAAKNEQAGNRPIQPPSRKPG